MAASWASSALGLLAAGACLKISCTPSDAFSKPDRTLAERLQSKDSKSEKTMIVTRALSGPAEPTGQTTDIALFWAAAGPNGSESRHTHRSANKALLETAVTISIRGRHNVSACIHSLVHLALSRA
jgi:head-tail adaptor